MRRIRLQREAERGATGIIVALVLVALFGFVSIGVDIAAVWLDRKQAQNGADAAALAIAQTCADDSTSAACRNYTSADTGLGSPTDYALKNRVGTQSFSGAAVVDVGNARVTATVTTTTNHWFAPLIGINSTNVSARAVAIWGAPSKGSTLPLAISNCWFFYQTGSTEGDPPPTGTHFVIPLKSKSHSTADGDVTCGTQAAHNEAAGGFGWLQQTSSCLAEIDLTNPWVGSDPGSSARDCSALEIQVGDTVLMPIFDQWTGSGNNVRYHIKSFAAFTITDYCFGPGMAQNTGWPSCKDLPLMNADRGPNISGTFVRFVEIGELLETSGGGVNMGAKVVRLVG